MDISYKDYYNQEEIKKEFLRLAKHKEVQGWFKGHMGQRPDCLHLLGDLHDLIRSDLSSLHLSEELWKDPLLLKPGMSKRELDDLRIGWDLLIDIDSKDFEYSKIVAYYLVEALKFHGIKNISCKFSGNRGFHIGVCFESFPKEVNGINIKDFFPDGVRVVASYLKGMIEAFVTTDLLKKGSSKMLAENVGLKEEDVVKNGKFQPYSLVDIDSVLISSRHMFRAPYSVNEKSGLVSIPVHDIKNFKREDAEVSKVQIGERFLDREKAIPEEAKHLLIQALDWYHKQMPKEEQKNLSIKRQYEGPKISVKEEFFPDCIKNIMKGLGEDGRKRAVFVLLCFLRQMGWSFEEIEEYLQEWNKRNYEALREGYVRSQISWFKRQGKDILPPNCSNEGYYKSMGVKCSGEQCARFKNPVNVALSKLRISSRSKKKKRKTIRKKE